MSNVREWLATNYGLVDGHTLDAANLKLKDERVWFPYVVDSNVVYNGGRSLNGVGPKFYYHKDKRKPPFYCAPGADTAVRVAVTEAQFDALICSQAGTPGVALGGSSASPEAIEFLRRKIEVVIVGDNDGPGQEAVNRLVRELHGHVRTLLVAKVPEGFKDISDYAAKVFADEGHPEEAVAVVIDEAVAAEPPLEMIDPPLNIKQWGTEEPEPVEMLTPHLPRGRRVLAYGGAGSSKSMWAAWVTTELVKRGRKVLYVSQENTRDEDWRRFKRLGLFDVPEVDRLLIFFHAANIDLAKEASLNDIYRYLDVDTALVVFDTLSACWSGDENDNRSVVALDRQVFLPMVTATGACVLVLDHTGHEVFGVTRKGPAGVRGASAKGQKSDVTLKFIQVGDSDFVIDTELHKFRSGNHVKPPPTQFRVEDIDDDGLTIVEVGNTEAVKVAEMANAMVQVIDTQGAMSTRQLRDSVPGARETRQKAMELLKSEDPPRVIATQEKYDSGGGPRISQVWRPVEDVGLLDLG